MGQASIPLLLYGRVLGVLVGWWVCSLPSLCLAYPNPFLACFSLSAALAPLLSYVNANKMTTTRSAYTFLQICCPLPSCCMLLWWMCWWVTRLVGWCVVCIWVQAMCLCVCVCLFGLPNQPPPSPPPPLVRCFLCIMSGHGREWPLPHTHNKGARRRARNAGPVRCHAPCQ